MLPRYSIPGLCSIYSYCEAPDEHLQFAFMYCAVVDVVTDVSNECLGFLYVRCSVCAHFDLNSRMNSIVVNSTVLPWSRHICESK